ncbi:MAG: rhomboid family intramembrane serine protease [Hymenobacteraceae bacterium]|mgnify:CR=1 FL=1|nr:rhomboid family intramembrane serine protease [Hymenobacteraceae bacterium]
MSVTILLIIITVGISWYAWKNHELMHSWIMYPYEVQRDNSWYRFITSGFLHADYIHLFFNMFVLYSFGRYIEYIMVSGIYNDEAILGGFGLVKGELLYLLIFIGGIIVSDIPTFIKHRNNPAYRALGASGGVASVVFASILFNPLGEIGIMFIPIGIPGFIFGLLYMIYSYYQGKQMGDNINHDAHLYGAVYGLIIALILVPNVGPHFIEQIKNW